jgi:hypothetical protein
MAAEIVQITPQDFLSQNYQTQDVNLITSFAVSTFLSSSSYIEFFIYDNNKNILDSDYNFIEYTILENGQSAGSNNDVSQIIIDPEVILTTEGYNQGIYNTYFNFFNKQIGSNLQQLYITEISSDRTEIRLNSTSLTNIDIIEQANSLIQQREDSPYFLDFYLNFGENQLAIANNIQLDNQDSSNPTILIKLYEALPPQFDINSTLWIVTLVEESVAYQVTFPLEPIIISDTVSLSGPNFNLNLKDQINNSTISLDYTTLTSTSLTSSRNQLHSLLEEKGIDINIDFTNFNDFIHFSSVEARLENFYYKMSLLEDYSSSIAILDSTTNNNPSSSLAVYEAKISDIITNFDEYDYYLYYSSGSWAWPKTTSQPPYQLATTGSAAVLTWFGSSDENNITYYGGISLSASIFDNLNQNNLYYSIPEYLRNDPANEPYQIFVEMVGQLYDNIWIYYKDVSQKYNADNRLESGISKDIVADAIRDFGIKLYQNNFSNDDLYTAFLGLTPEGGLFPFPNITGSLPTPSGFEYVDTLISASNDYIPLDDVNKSLYKRIYHNLPYLLKAKGTLPGLRTLITSYGIPDTVLRINEYGGKDKSNVNDWDYWQNTFNYAFSNIENNITTNWPLNSLWNSADNIPSTLEFRFKIPDLSVVSGSAAVDLWTTDTVSKIRLRYTGSGYTLHPPTPLNPSGLPYSGSIFDPEYQFTHLDFFPDFTGNSSLSASVYLPFANEGWWSVMATRDGNDFGLYAGNNVYEGGENGTQLGFYASSSVTVSNTAWTGGLTSQFMPQGNEMYLQEIRYYNTVLSESVFKDYIMNPYSSEGNTLNSAPDQLTFRLPLGGELYTGSISIHPKITGSWAATSSFASNSSASFASTPTFVPNTEYFFYDQPVVGIRNSISDKIRIENSIIPTGSVLSPFRSLAQNLAISQSYTANTNLLEVAFSPQNEIDQDIMDQIGYFDIGELIGDPRLRSSSATSYPDLDALRNEYFEKYTKNYDLNDFIRLIKFFDNSLFKMIKDFVPARTSLASGIVIKQHLLERNKYPQPQTDINSTIAYYSSGSQNNLPFVFQNIEVSGTVAPQWNDYNPGTIENFSGGTGGTMDMFNGVNTSPYGPNGTGPENIFYITQSWNEGIVTSLGIVNTIHDSQDEFYDGEFSGSVLLVTTQSLAQAYPLENLSFDYTPIVYSQAGYDLQNDLSDDPNPPTAQNQFLNFVTIPNPGEILLLRPYFILGGISPGGGFLPNITGPTFVKIHKFDNNGIDNTTALGQLTQLLIQYSTLSNYSTMNILTINEYPSYYLYEIDSFGTSAANLDNEILNYYTSASITTPYNLSTGNVKTITNWNNEIGDTLSYFNTSSGILTFENTPNIQISITSSLTTIGSIASVGKFSLIQLRNGVETIITQTNHDVSTLTTSTISSSLYPLKTDQYYFTITRGSFLTGFLQISSSQLLITQSTAPSAAENDPIIIEPYITTPNYYNSDFNPLINNVFVDRLSSIYQDVDYSTGIATPTNFGLLISGSALKAAVQDSNYTSKRVTLPRYEGVKSTSQHLNYWTPGDTGTYGKLPTIESLKTMVAYCDDIGGWPPERENASAAFVKYLIKSDGTVIIPNTSPNSLTENKGTFESGENVLIQYTGTGNQATPLRKVIRGGTRIEPILYTQFGQAPGTTWNTTMSFEDIVPSAVGVNGNYTALFKRNTVQSIINDNTDTKVLFTSATYGAIYLNSNGYRVPSNAVQDGVDLIFNPSIIYEIEKDSGAGQLINSNWDYDVTIMLYKGTQLIAQHNVQSIIPSNANALQDTISFPSPITIPAANLVANDLYYTYIKWDSEYISDTLFEVRPNSTFNIQQYPAFTLPVTSSGVNSIWNWPNSSSYPNIITSSQTTLTSLYGDPNVKMADITGSGFNSIILPWSIQYADEFKFEGNESYVYQVGKVFAPGDSGSGRIFQTGSIEVHFNAPLPVSASNFNLDHFAIRRYIDDASQVLIEGFKPVGSSGPYIVRPEYVVSELNRDVDDFILILKEKNLI